MAAPSTPIATLADFDARLQSLQRAAAASGSAAVAQIPMGQLFELAKDFVGASLRRSKYCWIGRTIRPEWSQ